MRSTIASAAKWRWRAGRAAWPTSEINDQPVALAPFALSRYPVTNAQYALFIADAGYTPDRPWWDTAGRAWLQREDNNVTGLDPWQRRMSKQQPEFWMHAQFGHEQLQPPSGWRILARGDGLLSMAEPAAHI